MGLVDAGGNIVDRQRTATKELETPDNVFQHAMEYANAKVPGLGDGEFRLAAVGVAIPGVLDTTEYVLREVVNLPDWLGIPLLDRLTAISQLPSVVVNDANSAAFAEHNQRNLGKQSLALMTLGTGVGAGVVFGGDPHGGDHGCAGELGHIAIEFGADALLCTCGSHGHLESYAGAAGVVARMKRALSTADTNSIPACLSGDITPKDIAEAAGNGYDRATRIVSETGDYVGRAIGFIGQVADPAVVLLGGAMTFGGNTTATGRMFLESVRQSVKATTLVQVGENIEIDFATLGNDAGMLGAAMLAKNAVGKNL